MEKAKLCYCKNTYSIDGCDSSGCLRGSDDDFYAQGIGRINAIPTE